MSGSNNNYIPEPGEYVTGTYKTGEYIGEVVETGPVRVLVKVLAVVRHPDQGDLHTSYNPDVAMFHERRALSYTEKVNVPYRDIRPYQGDIPDYKASLQRASQAAVTELDRLKRWSERSIEQLEQLAKDYKF